MKQTEIIVITFKSNTSIPQIMIVHYSNLIFLIAFTKKLEVKLIYRCFEFHFSLITVPLTQ